jgi:RNA polymerase sigma-70 factor (ECF subfamily)
MLLQLMNRNGGFKIKKINLRDYYPHYQFDSFVDVTDDIANLLREFELSEAAYRLRTYRHRAYYSLDRGDGIEMDALLRELSPYEVIEQQQLKAALYRAILSLPEKQSKRIYAHFFLGMSKSEIARAEGVSGRTVRQSIDRALASLQKTLEKLL